MDALPQPAKVSRALKQLQIDGNVALGGRGSLKRKRGQDRTAIAPPTPPRSHSVSSQHKSPPIETPRVKSPLPANRKRQSLRGARISDQLDDTIHVAVSETSVEAQGYTNNLQLLDGDKTFQVIELTEYSDEIDEGAADYWFLPNTAVQQSEADAPGRPPPSFKVSRRSSRRRTTNEYARASPRSSTPPVLDNPSAGALPDFSVHSEACSTMDITASRKAAKLQRELRKLEIRANPSLSMKESSPPDPETSGPQNLARGEIPRSSRRPDHVFDKSVRELNPADQNLPVRFNRIQDRRETRMPKTRANGQRDGRAVRDDKRPSAASKRQQRPGSPLERTDDAASAVRLGDSGSRPIEAFPTNPDPELVDHLLYLLADAADEKNLVIALRDKAQDAIRHEVRWESPTSRQRRIKDEITVLDSWELLDEEITNGPKHVQSTD
ncbi:hypothetical protein CAC42_367 [Sphaceloma murrayae]|uniref:Uncharacterized protein n=1 Tax=Sphaceloma murrayae TaxID=2082308 RepID=A0A2K1R090_9PEZI|nr:hypothetical protein CAC42_367 [Sphaceloma murrayae]